MEDHTFTALTEDNIFTTLTEDHFFLIHISTNHIYVDRITAGGAVSIIIRYLDASASLEEYSFSWCLW